MVGCPVEVQDTPPGADVGGSKEGNCRCPAVDDLVEGRS